MWIRSQDRERLINAQYGFTLSPSGRSISALGVPGVLASYSTKEKTLKVLSMIHFYLNKGYVETFKSTPQTNVVARTYGVVFQMPQDDEVDENA